MNGILQTNNGVDFATTIEGRSDVISTPIDGLVAVYTRNEGTSAIQIMMRVGADGPGFASVPIVLSDFGGLSATTIREAHIGYLGARPDGGGFTSLYVVASNTFDPANGYSNIGIQLVRGNGTVLASLDQISGTLSEILVRPDQSFYLVYQTAFGAAGDIKIRHIDKNGQQLGLDITINSNDPENAQSPSIAQLADGRFIVTWMDTTAYSDGSGSGINQQIIDPRDGIVDGHNNAAVAETLMGNDSTSDQMRGFAGADTMYGLAGADTIYGGDGADLIYGGRGDDTSYGGSDGDRIYGDLGDDEQYGEAGSDVVYSGAGSDLMDGGIGVGSDTAYYSSEKIGAIINLADQGQNAGSALGDVLLNFELIFGSITGADNITGSGASETILGNGGADILNGGAGNDTLRGGVGADTLNGGTGADKFQYTALNEVGDVIITSEAVDDFQFTRTAFGNLAGANVAALNFLSVASGHAATTVNHLFIFDQALDQLWYDADGSTATIAAVMVADLSNNINITNLDLLLI